MYNSKFFFILKKVSISPLRNLKFKEDANIDKHFIELIKGAGIAFVLRILGIIAGYIYTFLVTRTLGAESWGVFALSLVVLQIFSMIGRLGMDTALLKFTAEYTAKGNISILKEVYTKILKLSILFSILVAFLFYFLSPILANKLFHKPYLTYYFHIISILIIPFTFLWIHSEGLRGLKKIKECLLLQQLGIYVIAIFLFLLGINIFKSSFLPIISYGISILVLSLISIYLWYKYVFQFPSKFTLYSQTSGLFIGSYKYILYISMSMFLSNSLSLIIGWIDTIILGIFRTASEVGIYNVALKISMLITIVLVAVNTIAAPKFAELWGKGEIKSLVSIAQQSTKLIFLITLPILIIFLLFAEKIMEIFGKDFQKGTFVFIILVVGQFINVMAGSVGYILLMIGEEKFHRNILLIGVFINIILSIFLIKKWGILGAALANSITIIFWNVLFSIKVRKILKAWIFYPRIIGV